MELLCEISSININVNIAIEIGRRNKSQAADKCGKNQCETKKLADKKQQKQT